MSTDSELNADYSKCLINVAPAYERSLTGRGVTVAVLDNGLTSTPHQELPADRITEVYDWQMGAGSFHVGDAFNTRSLPNPDINSATPTSQAATGTLLAAPEAEYGVAVAGLLGGERGNGQMHGVAYEATIQMYNIRGIESGITGDRMDEATLVQELQTVNERLLPVFTAASATADIVNITARAGFSVADQLYSAELLRENLADFIRVAAQADRLPADRSIYVWAVGSPSILTDSPSLLSALPTRIPELGARWITVVEVNETGSLTRTPGCGIAAPFCLAAPGSALVLPAIQATYPISTAPDQSFRQTFIFEPTLRAYRVELRTDEPIIWSTTTYTDRSGPSISLSGDPTPGSLAAPLVSGTLALMKQAFPGMSSAALVNRLLATANSRNLDMLDNNMMDDSAPDYSNRELYGRGLLNAGAAVTPVGMTSLAAGGLYRPVNTFFSRSDNAQGLLSALEASLPAGQVMVQDSLGAPFWQPLASLPGVAPAPTDLSRQHDVSYWSGVHRSGRWHSKQLTSADALGHVSTGYVLDNRADSGSGSFFSLNVAPAYLTGLQSSGSVSGLRAGEFSSASFAAPWAGLLSGSSYGGGISFRAGRGIFTAASFQSEASSSGEGGTGRRQLLLSEYRLSANDATLLLQSGQLQEAAGWQGLNTDASVYGAFSSRSAWQSITGLTALSKRWHLAVSARQGQIALSPLTPGLLSAISGLRTHNLELGVLKRRVLLGDDSLSLKWSQQRIAGTAQWYLPAALHHDTVLYADATTSLDQSQTVFQARYQVAAGPQTRFTMQWTQLPSLSADSQLSWSLTHKFSAL